MNYARACGFPALMSTLFIGCLLALPARAEEAAPKAKPLAESYAPRLTELEQRVEAALDKKVNWKYEATPLNDIVADLAKQGDLPISIDEASLQETGLLVDQPLTFVFGTISLRQGLAFLSEQQHLGYFLGADGLRIGSAEHAAESLVTRVYPVSDLLPADAIHEGDWLELSDTITSTLQAVSWVTHGGTGSISAFESNLVISQSLEEQFQVANFLQALRQIQREQAQLKPGEIGTAVSLCKSEKTRQAISAVDSGSFEMELKWYAADITKVTKVPVILEPNGLEEAGATPDSMVTIKYRNAPVGAVMRETLRTFKLAPVLYEDCVVITSREKAAERVHVRLYPVSDLVTVAPGSEKGNAKSDVTYDFDTLVDLITSTISPDSWADNGGPSPIHGLLNPPTLVIGLTDELHDDVAKLLADLRVARRLARPAKKVQERIVQTVYPLYLARRQLQTKIALAKSVAEKPADKPAASPSLAPPLPAHSNVLPQFGGSVALPPENHDIATPVPSSEEVAELVRELVPDDSWQEQDVLLKPFHDLLIVRQRPAMLRKVENLLREIDAWQGASTGGRERPYAGKGYPPFR